jgi:hypothetical protein
LNSVAGIQKEFRTNHCSNLCQRTATRWHFLFYHKMAKEIQLTKGKVSLVDDADYDYLKQFKWKANNFNGKFYAVRTFMISKGNQSIVLMHRDIMKPKKGFVIDHIDGDTLNNLKYNLRICTHGENLRNQKLSTANKTGYKGVYFNKNNNKWCALIQVYNVKYHLGSFIDPVDAARAYNAAAIKYHGEFANINKID